MKYLFITLLSAFALTALAQPKKIAITIDDLPFQLGMYDSANLVTMNQMLVKHLLDAKVPAIGFVNEGKLFANGKMAGYRYEMLAEWTKNGLELGNHTFTHQDYNQLEPDAFFGIVEKGEPMTRKLMGEAGKEMTYFRHPFLHRGNTPEKVEALETYLKEKGYVEAPVTIDNSEWIFAAAFDKAVKEGDIAMQAKIGDSYVEYMMAKTRYYETQSQKLFGRPISHTLLIHSNALNAHYVDELLRAYIGLGYSFVSLQEALLDEAYQTSDTFVGKAGISWLDRWALSQGKKRTFFEGEPRCPEFILTYSGLTE